MVYWQSRPPVVSEGFTDNLDHLFVSEGFTYNLDHMFVSEWSTVSLDHLFVSEWSTDNLDHLFVSVLAYCQSRLPVCVCIGLLSV